MAKSVYITGVLASLAFVTFLVPAIAGDRCLDGSAPAGWKRPGGFCDISHDMRGINREAFIGRGGVSGPTLIRTFFNGYTHFYYYSDKSSSAHLPDGQVWNYGPDGTKL